MEWHQAGKRDPRPHGREWPKYATGPGEEQTAKVAENGEGGPKRGWNPATRHGGPVTAQAATARPDSRRRRKPTEGARGNTPRREVDSPDWERRRGDKPHGRRDATKGWPP